jgi:hypothetical protein
MKRGKIFIIINLAYIALWCIAILLSGWEPSRGKLALEMFCHATTFAAFTNFVAALILSGTKRPLNNLR